MGQVDGIIPSGVAVPSREAPQSKEAGVEETILSTINGYDTELRAINKKVCRSI
jgi:hypothetical protein